GRSGTPDPSPFGAAALLDVERTCPGCGARRDLGCDRARLRSGAIFLLEELCARAALSIELPRAPREEELPDAAVAALLRDAFGGYDELPDSEAEPARTRDRKTSPRAPPARAPRPARACTAAAKGAACIASPERCCARGDRGSCDRSPTRPPVACGIPWRGPTRRSRRRAAGPAPDRA